MNDGIDILDFNNKENDSIEKPITEKDYILSHYGEVITDRQFITNPAIERDEEIKKLILALLIPEKSAILIGKPGVGKTAIVEGLAYRIQKEMFLMF